EYTAPSFDPPHAEVQPHRRRDQHADGLHHDRLSVAESGPRFFAAHGISAHTSRVRQTALLLKVWMPVLPHHRHQAGQRLHRAHPYPRWIAADRSLDLRLDE